MALTYHEYLKLDKLLDLQHPRSEPPQHDEYLFIIIHQVYELWFKLLLIEFAKINRNFSNNELFDAIASFKRVRMILKTLVQQIDILETMTPMSFEGFRRLLETSSGFQSTQFRELEFLLGYKRAAMLQFHPEGSPQRALLEERLREPSVVEHFYDFLEHQGVEIPLQYRTRDVRSSTAPSKKIQEGILRLYRERREVAILFELMLDVDEGMQEWRYRHVKLVERTIGNKTGTGGSLGVDFLKGSLFLQTFPDLWEIRHQI